MKKDGPSNSSSPPGQPECDPGAADLPSFVLFGARISNGERLVGIDVSADRIWGKLVESSSPTSPTSPAETSTEDLEDHPEKLHEAAIFLLRDALQKAFPCQ